MDLWEFIQEIQLPSPSNDLKRYMLSKMRDIAIKMTGMGILQVVAQLQLAQMKRNIIAIEINPRVSRSSALASKHRLFNCKHGKLELAII